MEKGKFDSDYFLVKVDFESLYAHILVQYAIDLRNSDYFLFIVDFKSLYTNIPVQHAIKLMKEVVVEYKDVILNADFFVHLLEGFLENSIT